MAGRWRNLSAIWEFSKIPCLDICTYPYLPVNKVSTSNKREKIIATENTEITEDFFSVSSVLSVADKYKQ